MKIILSIVIVLGLLYGIVVYFGSKYAFKSAFLCHKKNKSDSFNALNNRNMLDEEIYNDVNMEDVQIKSDDGLILKASLIEKFDFSDKYIILVHGYSDNRHIEIPFVRMFLKENFNILIVDQRNHGDSEGEYPTYGYYERKDLDRWIDFLVNRKGKDLFIGLFGQSMGGATVLLCGANNNKVKFIIDDCGYSSAESLIKFHISKYKHLPSKGIYKCLNRSVKKKCRFSFEDVSPIKDICNSTVPILFIHGNNDKTVPYEMAEEMYKERKNNNDRIYIIDKCGHMESYGKDKEKYEKVVHEFLMNIYS